MFHRSEGGTSVVILATVRGDETATGSCARLEPLASVNHAITVGTLGCRQSADYFARL